MTTQTTIAVCTPMAKNIPTELMVLPQWVNWRFEERDEKLTKVPYTPQTGGRASTTDPTTWRPYVDAWQFLDTKFTSPLGMPPYDGVGFVFSEDDPFVGIDLDHCVYPDTDEIEEWAQEILDRVGADAYVEVSPSRTGIHIIIKGTVRGGGVRKGDIEMYSRGRFFTITGAPL